MTREQSGTRHEALRMPLNAPSPGQDARRERKENALAHARAPLTLMNPTAACVEASRSRRRNVGLMRLRKVVTPEGRRMSMGRRSCLVGAMQFTSNSEEE